MVSRTCTQQLTHISLVLTNSQGSPHSHVRKASRTCTQQLTHASLALLLRFHINSQRNSYSRGSERCPEQCAQTAYHRPLPQVPNRGRRTHHPLRIQCHIPLSDTHSRRAVQNTRHTTPPPDVISAKEIRRSAYS